MKVVIAIALLCLACALDAAIVKRETDLFDEDIGRVCFHGTNGNYTEQICPESEQMCQTAIVVANGMVQITAMCKQDKACENNQQINWQNCIGEEAISNNVQVCHFCCDTDLCNNEYDLTTLLLFAGQMKMDDIEE